MKRMQCELCGSSELVKEGDFFVCQGCGTKYSIENARKLFIEGTVKIDSSEDMQRYLRLAKEAFDSTNWAKAEEYSSKALEIDDANAEAWLIKGESIDWQCTVKNDRLLEALRSYNSYLGLMIEKLEVTIDGSSLKACADQLIGLVDNFIGNAKAEIDLYCSVYEKSTSHPECITINLNKHYQARMKYLEKVKDIVTSIDSIDEAERANGESKTESKADDELSSVFRMATFIRLRLKLNEALGFGNSLPRYIAERCNQTAVKVFNDVQAQWEKINPFKYWSGDTDQSHEIEQFDLYVAILDSLISIDVYCANILEATDQIRLNNYGLLKICWGNAANVETAAINATSKYIRHGQYGWGSPKPSIWLNDAAKSARRKAAEQYQINSDKYDFTKLLTGEIVSYKALEAKCRQRIAARLIHIAETAHPAEAEQRRQIRQQIKSLNEQLDKAKKRMDSYGILERKARKETSTVIDQIEQQIKKYSSELEPLNTILAIDISQDGSIAQSPLALEITANDKSMQSLVSTILDNVLGDYAKMAKWDSDGSVSIAVGPYAANVLSDLLERKATVIAKPVRFDEVLKFAPKGVEWDSLDQATEYVRAQQDG